VALDMTKLNQLVDVDETSGVVCVEPGMFGPDLEEVLQKKHGLTVGHFPQSFDISTVGGWVASRGAGQYSTRYGKIEDIVVGLEVVLADARTVRFGPHAATAQGPELMQLFIGSEGTLGAITKVWLRAHPVPEQRRMAGYSFASLETGIAAMRDAVRHGATPAVLRLYDDIESARSHGATESRCTLLVLDEGTPELVDATCAVVERFVLQHGGRTESPSLVEHWLDHRNDVSALAALTQKGFVIDTMEVTSSWSKANSVVEAVKRSALGVEGVRNASVHLSHSYLDGACLYFTFAAKADDPETTYVALWDAVQHAALDHGASLSHHHGVGMSRARFMERALGESMTVLRTIKRTLDPHGIFNPGKLALDEQVWP
jgi:alkyldihydroxyacetonephosphate synthase